MHSPRKKLQLPDSTRLILDNGFRFMGIGWFEAALATAYFAVLARSLGPALYAQWAYGVTAYMLVAGLAAVTLDTLILLHLGRDKRDMRDFIGLTLALRLVFLGLGAAGLVIYALAAETDPLSRLVLFLLIPALFGRGVALWTRVCFLGYHRIGQYTRITVLLRSAEALCGIVYLLTGGELIGVVVLHSLSWIAEAVCSVWRVKTHLTAFALRFAWRAARELLAQGSVIGGAGAGYIWLASGPIMLMRHTAIGMEALGQFAIVSSLATMLVGSVQAFFYAALPELSRSTQRADIGMAYGRITALAIIATAVAAAGIGRLVGPPIVQWTLGPPYAVAGDLLAWLMLICGVILAPTAYSQTLLLSGRRWPLAVADLAGGAFLAVAFMPAVARWGLDGAVSATACGWLVRAVLLIVAGEKCAWQSVPVRLSSGPRPAGAPGHEL